MPPGRHQSRPSTPPPPRWRWCSPPQPSLAPSLWKQQQAGAATDVGCLLQNRQLCNGNQGTENMNPTLQPGPPAPTLANEDPGTVGSSEETWQREPRNMSCRNPDSLGQQPAGRPEAVQPLTARPVTSRCVRALLPGSVHLGSYRLCPSVKQSWNEPVVS